MNPEMLEDVYNASQNAEGSAQKELDKYLDSINGKTAQFKNELQEIAYNLLDGEQIKDIIDLGTDFLSIVNEIISKLGSLPTVSGLITGIFGLKSALEGKSFINFNGVKGIRSNIKDFNDIENKDNRGYYIDSQAKQNMKFADYLKQVADASDGAKASLGGYVKYLVKTKASTSLLTAGTVALNTALSMGIGMLASFAVTKAVEFFDNLIVTEDELKEKSAELNDQITDLKSQLEGINSELSTNEERIKTLLELDHPTVYEEDELKNLQNVTKELEIQQGILKENLKVKKREAAETALSLLERDGNGERITGKYTSDSYSSIPLDSIDKDSDINLLFSTYALLNDEVDKKANELSTFINDTENGNWHFDSEGYITTDSSSLQEELDIAEKKRDEIYGMITSRLSDMLDEQEQLRGQYEISKSKKTKSTFDNNVIDAYENLTYNIQAWGKYIDLEQFRIDLAKEMLDDEAFKKALDKNNPSDIYKAVSEYLNDNVAIDKWDVDAIYAKIYDSLSNGEVEITKGVTQKTLSSWLEDENVSKLISDYENKVLNPISAAMEKFKDSSENYTWSKLITDFPEIAEYMDEGDDFFDSAYTYLHTKYSELKDKLDTNELEVADYDAFMEGLNQRGLQTLGATDNSEQLIANYKELIDVQETLAAGGKVEEMRMNKLIQKYPDLASSIKYTTDGYVLYDDVVRDAINTQATEANKSISSMIIYTQNMIELKLAEVKALNIATNAWETYWRVLIGRGQEFYQNSAGILQMLTENSAEARKYVSELQGSGAHYNEADLVQMVLAKFDPSGALSTAAQYQEDLLKLLENQRDAVGAGNKAKADAETSLGQVDNLANYLDRLNREVERLQSNLENTNGLDNQIAASKDYIKALKSEISVMQEATNEYEKRFRGENVAIDGVVYNLRKEYSKAQSEAKGNKGPSYDKLVELISSGKRVDITQFDSNVAGVINSIVSAYQQWQDEITQITEKQRTLREEITKTGERVAAQFDKITSEYENRQNVIETLMNNPDKMDNVNYYKALIENEVNATATIYRERKRLMNEYNDLITKGVTKSGFESLDEAMKDSTFADGVYNLKGQIDELSVSILEAENQTREWLQAMNQARWDLFDRINDQINSVIDETDYLVERLQSNKELFTDEGILNPEGLVTFGLYETQLEVHRNNIERVQAEINTLNQMITDDPTNTTLLDRRKEMIDLYHEETSAIDDTKESIISLVQDGFDKELDSLQKIIDKYKEALNSEKNLYDYQKNISSKTKDIAKLRKQIEAYANDTSEEARAKVQQLSVSLSDAQEDLRDTQYDRYISDQENILDELYTSYEKYLNDAIKDTDNILKGVGAKVDDNTTKISETINGLGVTVSDTLTNILAVPINGIESAISNNDLNVELLKESVLGISGDLKQYLQNYDITLDDTTLAKNVSGMFAAISQLNTNVDTIFKDQTLASSLKAISNIAEKWGKSEADATVSNAIDNPVGYNPTAMNAVQGALDKISDFNNKILSDNVDIKAVKWKDGRWEAYTDSFPESAVADTKAEAIAALKKKMKKANAYAVGSKKILDDEWAWTQENGNEIIMRPSDGAILTPLAKGDSVLTSAASENLWNMANDPTKFIKAYSAPKIIGTTRAGNVTNEVHMSITLPNVTNYTEFVTQLQKDKRFESMIQDMTVNQLTNAGSLAKFKYKF